MIRETPVYRVLCAIHIVFFTSLLCFGTVWLSGTILMVPAIGASFLIGKDALYKELDVTNSIIATYFKYLKASIKLLRYSLLNILIVLNVAGMIITASTGNFIYSCICLAIVGFLLSFMLYIAGYHTFVSNQINITEVFLSMFIKLHLLLPVFIVMVLCVLFFSGTLLTVIFLSGTLFLFVLEVLIFIQMVHFKAKSGKLDKDDKFAYLVGS
jgi:hypothetical protein